MCLLAYIESRCEMVVCAKWFGHGRVVLMKEGEEHRSGDSRNSVLFRLAALSSV
jgi:hypothetical protein